MGKNIAALMPMGIAKYHDFFLNSFINNGNLKKL